MATDDDAKDVIAEMRAQLTELRAEVESLGTMVREKAGEAYEDAAEFAENVFEDASSTAQGVARHVQHEAMAVAEVARENPVVTSGVLATVAVMGVALGFALGTAAADQHNSRRWRF